MTITAREIHLTHRPTGRPGPEHFRLVDTPLPPPGPGQVLVRNRYLAMRAVMRALMTGTGLPLPSYRPGEVMWGPAIGEVVAAGGPGTPPPGTLVAHRHGWRDHVLADASEFRELPDGPAPLAHLAQADTAYVGLVEAAGLREGDTVFVSGAAGSVGVMAGQIARLKGAGRVVGSAGSPAKAAWLVGALGFDAAFDRHDGPIADRLTEAAPDGVDVCFDNVGGEQLQAAVLAARPGARVALCGALAHQNADGPAGPGQGAPVELDTLALVAKRVSLRGFSAHAHPGLRRQCEEEVAGWLRDGRLTVPSVHFGGLDQAPRALLELLEGRHTGNVVVEL
ncbi:zinc-binding dehydrogenase [Streptosporangium sp. V21-05]|uniref:zinc-binding dehydrogenase n=1 Tax=Streptosporangium sp. V21-05 TaxID=3446115 RepID=UPI003F52ED29